ncbi:MAG TPA: TIGR03621 family F420-dependent LLM class oxidoreductase [Acidimicrobiales bacterium]|nr:TIGR03621 family F420-dependent LLM class oxidoreductase [Acidimicrobiales bacterium]
MAHPRPFRFGVQLSTAPSGEAWATLARRAEDLGYSSLFLPDHFGGQLAPVPAMQAAADATTSLRVGCLVFDNDYKHPVVLAKEVATIDVLSGGRVELGIGAGWMNSDYEQSGIQHDRAGVRIDRMEEGIAVLKGLFADGAFSFEGEHYRITGLDGQPKPVQRPHPPILIGGGAKRVLTIAGREADIVGINPSIVSGQVDADAARNGAADVTDQKLEWVRAAAGDRYTDIEINMLIFAAMLTDDPAGTKASMAPLFGLEPSDIDDYPHAWIGTVDSICDDLQKRRERWDVSYLVVQGDAMEAMAPVVARLAGT